MEAPILLDILSAVLLLALAGWFLRVWLVGRVPDHLLYATGFVLLALGTMSLQLSLRDSPQQATLWDGLRISGQTAAPLVFFFAYLTAVRHGRSRPVLALGWTAALLGAVMAAVYALLPPFLELPLLDEQLLLAHSVQLAGYIGCFILAGRGFAARPALERALVPLAFASYALSKYTWVLIDLSHATELIPFIYLWRFVAIGLFLLAVLLPTKGVPRAP